jgi:hypothetical protein
MIVLAVNLAAEASPAVPWLAKVLVGLLIVIVTVMIGWLKHAGKISFGEFEDYVIWLLVVGLVVGFCVMLWGVGISFPSR